MTNKELIHKIVALYSDARDAAKGFESPEIIRGRKHSISSLAEDVLAWFIKERIANSNIQLWVDYPISFKSNSQKTKKGNWKTITIYPDICLVDISSCSPVIRCMVDLKMDIGWKRELFENLEATGVKHKVALLRELKLATYKPLDENGNKSVKGEPVMISSDYYWHVVLMNGKNIPDKKLQETLIKIEQGLSEHVKVYTFSSDEYLNGADLAKVKINDAQIDAFLANLAKEISS